MSISVGLLMPTGSAAVVARRDAVLRISPQHPVRRTARRALEIAALTQFVSDISRYILRPFLSGVEGDDPDRACVLAFEQIDDDGFQIVGFDVSFTIGSAIATKIIDEEVDIQIVALRHDRRRPACSVLGIRKLHKLNRTGSQCRMRTVRSWDRAFSVPELYLNPALKAMLFSSFCRSASCIEPR